MKLTGNPGAMLAVLVGVERYADPDLDLRGPATNVLRLAHWLLDQGVRPERILIYANFADLADAASADERAALRERLRERGIPECREPTRYAIEEALEPDKLPGTPNGEPGSLLLYLSGHGCIREGQKGDDDRYALMSDTRRQTVAAIDVKSQALSLRRNATRLKYPRQCLIQDACAERLSHLYSLRSLAIVDPANGNDALQYSLYSSRPDERSETDERGGYFTAALLDVLAGNTLHELDLETVYEALSERFKKTDQHPTLTRCNECGIRDSLTVGSVSSRDAIDALTASIHALSAIGRSDLQSAYRNTVPGDAELPSGNVAAILRRLESLVDDGTGLRNVDRFALHLMMRCQQLAKALRGDATREQAYRDDAGTIRTWIDRWPGKSSGPALRDELNRLEALDAAADNLSTIVVQPDEAENVVKAWRFFGNAAQNDASNLAAAWRHQDGVPYHRCAMRGATPTERIANALAELCEEWVLDEAVVELVLPFKQMLDGYVGLDVQINAEPEVLEKLGSTRLPLKLRIRERWTNPRWLQPWLQHWGSRAASLTNLPNMIWAGSNAVEPKVDWYWLGTCAPDQNGCASVEKSLFLGAPFVVWVDDDQRPATTTLLTRHSYADMTPLLRAIGDRNASGKRIACLVDDPRRVPPGASPLLDRLSPPSYRPAS